MASNSASASGGIGFTGLLTILFVGLKLTGHINWSWWWVFSPILIAAGLSIAFLILIFVVALMAE